MIQILNLKSRSQLAVCKFIERNYEDWFAPMCLKKVASVPMLTDQYNRITLFKELVLPELKKKDKAYFIVVIDNLRYDQWKTFETW
jgi:hypothetical protein